MYVVAGVIRDARGRILLAQRPPGKHLAGLWEYPGGKLEAGETPEQALARELHEELGIHTTAMRRLIRIPWHYPDKDIVLDVFDVLAYNGEPSSCEGQQLQWHALGELSGADMPPADRPVLAALKLPHEYAISPEPTNPAEFLTALDRVLARGVRLVQLRGKTISRELLRELVPVVLDRCRAANARLLLNGDIALAQEFELDGVHLTSAQLMQHSSRPLPTEQWLAASCHDEAELQHAMAIGVDFVTLSPVSLASSHPHAPVMGWEGFAALCAQAALPVYALGGLRSADADTARVHGAQGIAGISTFWS
ncbi:Nudix family hydrolase [Pseudolysobacter antarcticus]|uniref:8-oxo-dGTP diphosphatase n=2 Tax=Pseudolysobacter antarcticus TaxID=2511995 RepID=A0A411HQ00_9GAMM|nr:Nudix family hydrolase [Pseudolysobacter antarcticus]